MPALLFLLKLILVLIALMLIQTWLKQPYRRLAVTLRWTFRHGMLPVLLPPTPEQKRYFWITALILSTMLLIGMSQLLFSCREKPAQTRPTVYTRDTIRERLQRQADAAVDTVATRKKQTTSTQKPYENAVSEFDSLRPYLGF